MILTTAFKLGIGLLTGVTLAIIGGVITKAQRELLAILIVCFIIIVLALVSQLS